MKALGIDIGLRFIKAALVHDNKLISFGCAEATCDPLSRCREILADMPADRVVATGNGRHLLEVHGGIPAITEINACARGARKNFPSCRTVIDIGGQNAMAIILDEQGVVRNFGVHERCAAGTGRYLEVMARTLDFSLDEFASLPLAQDEGLSLSRICAAFAESEVDDLLCKGIDRRAIGWAAHRAVAGCIGEMVERFTIEDEVILVGGCANNGCLRLMIEERLGRKVKVSDMPAITGALGAALYAAGTA